ncbi:hypothetical protein [Bordetella pertussis]|nr:hypothetical protein [Bordetella pertussis]ETH77046.1 hypothetical protein L555_3674 [Bordetella pertussis STO1-CHOC-0008]
MHGSSEPDLRSCTHLQTQPGRIQPIDSSQLAFAYQILAGAKISV